MSRTARHTAWLIALGLGLGLGLAACSEKSQTATERKVDDKPWADSQGLFMAPGYAAKDQVAWEAQLKARSRGQNEYNRTPGRP